jgi:hypothetical protein
LFFFYCIFMRLFMIEKLFNVHSMTVSQAWIMWGPMGLLTAIKSEFMKIFFWIEEQSWQLWNVDKWVYCLKLSLERGTNRQVKSTFDNNIIQVWDNFFTFLVRVFEQMQGNMDEFQCCKRHTYSRFGIPSRTRIYIFELSRNSFRSLENVC